MELIFKSKETMKTNNTSAILAVAASIAAMVSCQKEETSVPA